MINATQSNSCNATIRSEETRFLLQQTFTAMSPEAISGPENNLRMMYFSFVLVQCISRPGCFAANVTRVGDPSDMVALNVISYISQLAFFSTHFTKHCFSFRVPHHYDFSSVLHHGLDLVIQLMKFHTD